MWAPGLIVPPSESVAASRPVAPAPVAAAAGVLACGFVPYAASAMTKMSHVPGRYDATETTLQIERSVEGRYSWSACSAVAVWGPCWRRPICGLTGVWPSRSS